MGEHSERDEELKRAWLEQHEPTKCPSMPCLGAMGQDSLIQSASDLWNVRGLASTLSPRIEAAKAATMAWNRNFKKRAWNNRNW